MKKLLAAVAAVLMAATFTFASPQQAEARHGGRFVAGLALGLAGAAILSRHHRHRYGYYPYYYSGYPGYYDYDYYPRWRHHRRHRHHHHHRHHW